MSFFRWIIVFIFSFSCSTWALPEDFQLEEFVTGLRDPATMAVAPDGRIFVGERIKGEVRVVTSSGQLLPSPFLTLDVPEVRHRSGGLRGFAFDPDFPAEPYLYVFYTKEFAGNVRHNRISRFTVSTSDPNLADPVSELVLMELPFNDSALGSSGSHNGGAVVFGGDGKLYFTTGDGWRDSAGYGAGDNVQSLSTYTGKIFRINRDGSIPADNPFFNQTSGNYRAIYALGFRNPYAATTHPVTGEIFVFDVGTAHGGDKDYVYRIAAGENYGHDGNSGIGTSGSPWANVGTPIVSGGVWYFSDQFPPEYRERLFVTSWRKGLKTVRSITDPSVQDFGSADVNNQGPLYPCVGLDGSIYILDSTYETGNGRIYRLSYPNLNRAEAPEYSPNGGQFTDQVDVEITSTTPDSTIRYTTDGTTPDETSPLYSAPIELTSSTTLKARSFAPGFDPSVVSTAVFQVEVSIPPQFTNLPPSTSPLGHSCLHTAAATGNPAPVFSLDAAPEGMTIHPETGELFWVPDGPGNFPVVIRASNGIAPDAVQTSSFSVSSYLAADGSDPAALTQGFLRYSYYEDSEEALTTGLTPVPNLNVREREDHFQIRFEGFIEIATTGNYQFEANSSGETKTIVSGIDVSTGTFELEAGLHTFSFEYSHAMGPKNLDLRWTGPGIADQPIPASAFSHHTAPFGIHDRPLLPSYLGTFPLDESGNLPALLSQTGAFSNLTNLLPRPGVIPFSPNAKLWSDGATKRRWIALPTHQKITFTETGVWDFPAGTTLIKHFELGPEKRRLETRFEIMKEGGGTYLVTYQWRPDQSDADLVPSNGASETISFSGGTQQWTFPTRADCVACHNSSVGYVLGASTRQLNGPLLYSSGISDNQLRTWTHLDMFDAPPAENTLASLNALGEVDDESLTLEHRVRSYLDSNCAYCHNTNAAPEGTNFVLEFETPLDQSNLIEGLASDHLGLGLQARLIASRDPRNSVLYQRLAGNDPETRMPPVGRDIVHSEARETLVRWILSLPASNTNIDVTDYSRAWSFNGDTGDGLWRDPVETPTYEAGQLDQALNFDGADDAVDLGPLDVTASSALTITFWFKADDFGTHDARFLSKADGQFDDDHYWMVSTLNETKLRFRLKAGGVTTNLISPSNTITSGTWTHVAARYDGATMKIFKNGIEVASVAKSGVLDTNGTVDAAIGNQPTTATGGGRPFDGLIDEMRIYSRALSDTEIAMVRDAGSLPNDPPLIQINAPAGAVGSGNFLTRANAANLSATATDSENGDLTPAITWLSTTMGDITPGALSDGPHSLIATTRDGNGSADSALIQINVVPGFEGWAADHNVPPSPQLDPNQDGLPLLMEYAFGLDPNTNFSISPVSTAFDMATDELTMTFPIVPTAIDLSYRPRFGEFPGSLLPIGTWTPLGESVMSSLEGTVTADENQIQATSPTMGRSTWFGNLKIEKR